MARDILGDIQFYFCQTFSINKLTSGMNMNKKELVQQIVQHSGLKKGIILTVLDSAFSAISTALKENQSVTIKGFGRFSIKERPARNKINSETGETIEIPARTIITFVQSKNEDESSTDSI